METLMMYLLKMLICSGILYGYYRLALYNERFHQWNRFYLLAAMFLSVLVPLLNIPVFATEEPGNVGVIIASMPWNVTMVQAQVQTELSWQDVALLALSIVSLALFVKLIINVARLYITYKTNPVNKLDENVELVFTQLKHAPFSFFNWLFWRQDIDPSSDNGQRMLTHELTHIYEHHSADKIFTEVLMCVFWMNPFFWLMRRELGIVHEFLADRRAIGKQDGAAFAAMILHALQLQPSTTSGLVNPFFSSTIKRRLLMITTSKEPRYSYLRRLSGLVLMICSAIVLTLSIQEAKAQEKEKAAEKKISGKPQKTENLEKRQVTNIPVTKPGEVITLQADSIIWKDGKGEAIGTTSSGEKVKIEIARQQETANRVFLRLATQDTSNLNELEVKDVELENIDVTELAAKKTNTPLYIVDGVEVKEIEIIEPDNIKSISVLKDASATSKYGEKGKNGVINISLKNKLEEAPVRRDTSDKRTSLRFEVEKHMLQEVVVLGYANPKPAAQSKTSEGTENLEAGKVRLKEVIPNKVFTRAEQQPQFPGGEAAWKKYLAKNLRYPEAAQKEGKEGIARVSFIIDTEGNVRMVKILSAPTNHIGEEAMRLIKQGPKWIPAMQNGKKVTFSVDISIDFKMNKYF